MADKDFDDDAEPGEAEFLSSELTHFADYDVVLEAILSFCGPSDKWGKEWKAKWEWLGMVLAKYQEQPTILNPHLEDLITPITNRLIVLMESFGVFDGAFEPQNYLV
jgi:hypothetical protein